MRLECARRNGGLFTYITWMVLIVVMREVLLQGLIGRGEGRAELSLGLIVETPSHQQRYLETVSLINLLSREECACVWTRTGP